MVDFNVVVIDDRSDFANRERFPEAPEIIVDDFRKRLSTPHLLRKRVRGHSDEGTQA